MQKLMTVLIIFVLTGVASANDIVAHLQNVAVTIKAGGSEGSGVVKTRVLPNGDVVNYVWTAGHVVDSLRKTRIVIDGGSPKTVVEFDDAAVVQEIKEDGRTVGEIRMMAEVLRYSNANTGDDLALLRIRKKNFLDKSLSIQFYLDDKIPEIGTELLHVGSLLGQAGANSLTTGIISQHGRVLNNKVYDQSTAPAFPGSSGGVMAFKSNGLSLGMLVRGSGETFNLYIPVRRMREWAKRVGVEFALDDKVLVPSDEELKKNPREDSEFGVGGQKSDIKGFIQLIRTTEND